MAKITPEFTQLCNDFYESLTEAENRKQKLFDYIEKQYDVDISKLSQFEDDLTGCYDINGEKLKKYIRNL